MIEKIKDFLILFAITIMTFIMLALDILTIICGICNE